MPYEHVLVTTDLSEAANACLHTARDLAALMNASLCVLHVLEPEPTIAKGIFPSDGSRRVADYEKAAEDKLHELGKALDLGEKTKFVVRRHASAVEGILEQVEEDGTDLVVIGTRGRSGLQRLLIGSVTERVVRHAKVAVLTVKV